jgi:hypothetical protein
LNGEIKRRTEVVGIFPNEAAITRLIGAILLEQNDEWAGQRCRCMTLESVAAISDDADVSRRGDDAELRTRIRDIASERRRFGYRGVHVLLQREGVRVNHKKLRRLYAEEKLPAKRRGGQKRARGTTAADRGAGCAEPALAAGFRLRRVHRLPPVSDPNRCRTTPMASRAPASISTRCEPVTPRRLTCIEPGQALAAGAPCN